MDRRRLVVTALVAILIPFLWCFGEALSSSRTFAHRDASLFYHPLFEWTVREWKAGRVPWWNPQENCGTSVVGDTTSSVFYPGKLVLFLPFAYAFNAKLYVILHVLLAALFAFLLARCWRMGVSAATLSALCYAFSGYVLFQYSNVVFLVGAAWLPASLLAADRMLRRRRVGWAIVLGATLALMTLGGDPQTAYHVGLLAVMYGLLLWCKRVRRRGLVRKGRPERSPAVGPLDRVLEKPPASQPPARQPPARRRLSLLTLAAVTGGILAIVQIIPSMQWAARSERASFYEPRSVYQIPTVLLSGPARPDPRASESKAGESSPWSRVRRGMFGSPTPDTHHRNLYRYSIAPWQLVELIVPNLAGKPFPDNRRIRLTDDEGVDWVPSLYLGLLPLGLALSVFTLRGRSTRIRWLSWAVLLATLGSFGWYGPGWLLRALALIPGDGAAGAGMGDAAMGEPVGGIYWLMVVVLPGYDQFRYPAKLFLIATMGLSLLAAHGWQRMLVDPRRLAAVLATGGVAIGLGLIAALIANARLATWLGAAAPDALYGPVVVFGALRVLYVALVHAAMVCGACWLLIRFVADRGKSLFQVGLLLITSLELAVAQGWMIETAPADVWQHAPWAARQIASHQTAAPGPFRVLHSQSARFLPSAWRRTSDVDREATALRWSRDTLRPRTHLTTDISLLEAPTSMTPDDFQAVIGIARQFGPPRHGDLSQPHPHVLDAFGVAYLIQADRETYIGQETAIGRTRVAALPDQNATLWSSPRSFPRAWIVHRVEWLPTIGTRDAALTDALTAHVFFPNGRVRNLRTAAAVEVDDPPDPQSMRPSGPAPARDVCRVDDYGPQRVEIVAELAGSGLVVLSDYYEPNWELEVVDISTGERVPSRMLRTNRIMRGVFLPAGRYRITYRYAPRLFWFAALLSGVGWIGCAVLLVTSRLRHA